jgi:hypothetical protein
MNLKFCAASGWVELRSLRFPRMKLFDLLLVALLRLYNTSQQDTVTVWPLDVFASYRRAFQRPMDDRAAADESRGSLSC